MKSLQYVSLRASFLLPFDQQRRLIGRQTDQNRRLTGLAARLRPLHKVRVLGP
jgi:hypothetical protein